MIQSEGEMAVAASIMVSDESFERIVEGYYGAFLQRAGEATGEQYWFNLLASDRLSGTKTVASSLMAAGANSPAGVGQAFLAGNDLIDEYFADSARGA
jgi:hypothetical protein